MSARTRTVERPRTDAAASAVDRALARGRVGRERLPERCRAEFDAVLDAWELYEAGRDDAARERLAVIGLTTPCLEWKLAIRGLIAYAAGDDGRAIDNWARLSPQRLPARLIAPLRVAIDPAFLAGTPGALKKALQSAGDRLHGETWRMLRSIQRELARPDNLPAAVAQLPSLMLRARRDAPDLVQKLARCFYAAAAAGHPDGERLLRRHFDAPADDPNWSRLQALAAERRGEWTTANRHWERYQSDLAVVPGLPDRGRARALVWIRCAENARRGLSGAELRPASLSVEKCWRRALSVDPNNVEAIRGLFDFYRRCARTADAMEMGLRIADIDPDDGDCAIALAELLFEQGDLNQAIAHYERARILKPFDEGLAAVLGDVLRTRARRRALHGDRPGAETDLERADAMQRTSSGIARSALRAAICYLFGDHASGDRWASEARAIDGAAAAFALLAEATRFKLPRTIRQPFDADWQAARRQSHPKSVIALAEMVLEQSCAPLYRGAKSHIVQARQCIDGTMAFVDSVVAAERLCGLLDELEWVQSLRLAARILAFRFPSEPAFPYFEARSCWLDDSMRGIGAAPTLLTRARRLAGKLADPQRAEAWTRRVVALATEWTDCFRRFGRDFDHDHE